MKSFKEISSHHSAAVYLFLNAELFTEIAKANTQRTTKRSVHTDFIQMKFIRRQQRASLNRNDVCINEGHSI